MRKYGEKPSWKSYVSNPYSSVELTRSNWKVVK